MNRYTINTYDQAVSRIAEHGHLFDTGQIAPNALTQLYLAMREGKMTCARDTWPIRGLIQDGKCPVKTVWQMVPALVES